MEFTEERERKGECMKKNLSIVMVVLLGLAWYVTLSTWLGNERKYNDIIAEAQRLEEKGLYLDAITQYEEAKKIKGEVLVLEEYIADDYFAMGDYKEYRKKLNEIIARYGPVERDVTKLYDFTREYFSEDSVIELVSGLYEKYPDSELVSDYYDEMKGKYEERTYTYEKIYDFSGEYAVYEQEGKKGILGLDGKSVIEAVYDEIKFDGKDMQAISVKDGEDCFFINQKGYKTKMPEEAYTWLGAVSQSRIVAEKGGKYGYLDKNFNPKTDFVYDDATPMYEGIGAVKKRDKWALINKKGELVTEFIFDDIARNSQGICSVNKIIAVKQGGVFFFINGKGERLSEQSYEAVKAFETDSMCAVCRNGKWGFIDKEENLMIPCSYEDAKPFANGYAAVQENGIWGYIDENNYMAIRPIFDEAGLMTINGVAPVRHGNTWTLIQLKIKD